MAAKGLIVDDDVEFCETIELFLQRRGCDVVVRHDPTRGLTAFQNSKPNFIMLDVNMPLGGGKLLYETLCRDPTFEKVPVIIMTGAATDTDIRSLAGSGSHKSTWLVRKPIDFDVLNGLLTRLGI